MKTPTRWAQAAAIPIAVPSASDAPAAIAPDAVYDARTGSLFERVGVEVQAGDAAIDAVRVVRVTADAVEVLKVSPTRSPVSRTNVNKHAIRGVFTGEKHASVSFRAGAVADFRKTQRGVEWYGSEPRRVYEAGA